MFVSWEQLFENRIAINACLVPNLSHFVPLFSDLIPINARLVPLLCHFVPGADSCYLPTSAIYMALHDLLKARIYWVLEKIGLCKRLDLLVGMQHQGFQCFCDSNN